MDGTDKRTFDEIVGRIKEGDGGLAADLLEELRPETHEKT